MTKQAIPHLALVYAKTLRSAARDADCLDTIDGALRAIERVLHEEPDWLALLSNPSIPLRNRREFVVTTSKVLSLPDVVVRWLSLLMQKGRMDMLAKMIAAYDEVHRNEENQHIVVIETAFDFEEQDRNSIETVLKEDQGLVKQYPGAERKKTKPSLFFEWQHVPSLLSGMRINVHQRLYDHSLEGELNGLHRWLKRV